VSFIIGHDDGVRGGFHQRAKPFFALAQGALHAFSLDREALHRHRSAERRLDHVRVVGLGQAGKRALDERPDRILRGREPGEDNNRQRRIQLGEGFEDRLTVEIRQAQVQQDRTVHDVLRLLNGLGPLAHGVDAVAFVLQQITQGLAEIQVVVHDQDLGGRSAKSGGTRCRDFPLTTLSHGSFLSDSPIEQPLCRLGRPFDREDRILQLVELPQHLTVIWLAN